MYKSTIGVTLLLTAAFQASIAVGQGWPASVSRSGDTGLFQDVRSSGADSNVILVPQDGRAGTQTEICSYRPTGVTAPPGGTIGKNCFRFQSRPHADNNPGAMVILIHDAGHFANTGPDQFSNPKRANYASVWQYSERWTGWTLAPGQGTGLTSFRETRSCSLSSPTHSSVHGLIVTWPGGCDTASQSRTQSCNIVWGPWSPPEPEDVSDGVTYTRTRSGTPGNDPWGVCATSQSRPFTGNAQIPLNPPPPLTQGRWVLDGVFGTLRTAASPYADPGDPCTTPVLFTHYYWDGTELWILDCRANP